MIEALELCLVIPPCMHYLIDTTNLLSEISSNLDRAFGKQYVEEDIIHLESETIRGTIGS